MTFEQWEEGKDWWRSGTHDTLHETWCKLVAQNVPSEVVAEAFDAVIGAIREEYGE